MTWWRIVRDRLRALVGRERVASEIQEEIEHHRRSIVDQLQAAGHSREDAERAAAHRLGNAALLQDAGYDVRGGGWLEALVQDLRYASRFLRGSPAFALVSILTLALGIGVNTAIFSVANGVLLRPLPYPDADRLAMVWMDNARIQLAEDWHSYPDYRDYLAENRTFEDLAIFNATARTLTGLGDAERIFGAHSSANLFDVLGVRAALGRTYTVDEDQEGAGDVVVLSHGLWQRAFGGRDDVTEQSVELNGRRHRIIGVMPDGFAFPSAEATFWVPTAVSESRRTSRGTLWLQMIGRLRADTTVAQAQADLDRVNVSIQERFPDQQGYGVNVVGYHDQMVGSLRPAVLVLAGAVVFVLLIACANVANLLLARASVRERELAVRSAIGAGRGRIVRQLLTESVLVGCLGGAAGLALAWMLLEALVSSAPANLPRLDAIVIDRWVLAFTAGISILTGILFGLAPAIQAGTTDLGRAFAAGTRGATGGGRRVRQALVVAEVALAVVLLVGAGLMLRSFVAMQRVDLGFDPDRVVSARVVVPADRYAERALVVEFFEKVVERVSADPAVEGAAGVGTILLSATPRSTNFSIEGRPDFAPEARVEVPVDPVTPNYFEVMRVALLRGRFFDRRDSTTAPLVVIINQTMARMFWPDEDPLGRRIKYGTLDSSDPWRTIIGVVADTRRTGYDAAVRPETFLPHAQLPDLGFLLVARAADDVTLASRALRSAVRAVDPLVPVSAIRPLDEELGELAAQRRLNTVLLAIFGLVSALLAAVGIYGVIAYSVEQRTRELGVRLALGASGRGVLAMILRDGLKLCAAGVVIGLAAAFALSRGMASMLYQTSPADPATFAAIAALAGTVSLLACLIPAIRALRVDPITALRTD